MKDQEKALSAQEMFDNLKNSIGKPIKCNYWKYGEKKENVLTLREVKDFMGIDCVGEYIPFIGQGVAISEIRSNEDEILYANPYVEEEYNRMDDRTIKELQDLSYGKDSWPVNNRYSDWVDDPAFYESESDYSSGKTR